MDNKTDQDLDLQKMGQNKKITKQLDTNGKYGQN